MTLDEWIARDQPTVAEMEIRRKIKDIEIGHQLGAFSTEELRQRAAEELGRLLRELANLGSKGDE